MRASYLVIGILIGSIFVSNHAIVIMDYMTKTFETEISIYTLVGYYEGWDRGASFTYKEMYWSLVDCTDELNRMGRGK
jgi:hypothetical protein